MGKKATGCIKNLPTNYRCTRSVIRIVLDIADAIEKIHDKCS